MIQASYKRRRLFGRVILLIIAAFVFILFVVTVLLNYYKDDIGREVLLRVNNIQQGDLNFEDISFNPFVHFPNISLELDSVDYYERQSVIRVEDTVPIVRIEKLYIAFDVLDLIKGDVNVSNIYLENSEVSLVMYSDSTLNLLNAFDLGVDTLKNNQDTIQKKSSDFELNLERVVLRNMKVTYSNLPENNFSDYNIQSLDASLNYWPDTIKCLVKSNITISNVTLGNGLTLHKKSTQLETSLVFDRHSHKVKIYPSKFLFGKANFEIGGYIDFLNDGFIDLIITGDDKDFSVLHLFLKDTGIENIKQGDLFFNSTVKGSLITGIPQVDCSFGLNNVNIQIPGSTESISNLSLKGSFQSGRKKDLSEASLAVEKIVAKLPGGNLNGSLAVKDFQSPNLEVLINMKANITGFENIFELGELDSLSGYLEIKTDFSGKYEPTTKTFSEEIGQSSLRCDSISFNIPGFAYMHNVNGMLRFDMDTLLFEDFCIEIDKSDFNINGSLTNVLYTLLNVKKEIYGNLHISSNAYNFPDFFKYDPRVANNFPYQIKDIDLDVNVLTSTLKLSEFIKAPEIEFDIQQLKAEIEDFLPPVNINSGIFNLGDQDSSLNLDFSDFDIDVAGSKLLADVIFNSPQVDPDWLSVDLEASNINPQKTFVHWFADSISEYLNARLDGEMHLDLILSLDTINFDKLDFTADHLMFVNSIDTFDVHQMRIDALDVNYDLKTSSNIIENLDAKIDLTINKMYSNHFNVNDLDYKIDVKKGAFYVQPRKYQFFNQMGEGSYVLRPFEEIPSYELKYKVQQFDVGPLFSTFLKDTVLSGKMDLDIDIKFQGTETEMIKKSLHGKLLFTGNDLTIYGLDLDKVIDRFKRSQHFTFADAGAVLLMGPAGILVTKGSDFASMVVLNPGESSRVVQLSSEWELQDGMVNLSDVAFTTNENRMAAKGWINIMTDSLDIDIALLNESGCSLYSQGISGSRKEPDIGKVKVMKSIFAPVTNLVKGDCEVFYNGKVKQPAKK